MPLPKEVYEIRLHVVVRDLIGGPPIEAGEAVHRP
jgi:hypothetical protein